MGCDPLPGGMGFVCRKWWQAEPCFACTTPHRKRCQGPGKGPDKTCDRPLCDTHARRRDGKDMCATHAPSQVSPNMPRPPGRKP
jgi:hypothetical protein